MPPSNSKRDVRDRLVMAALTGTVSLIAISMALLGLASWLEAISFVSGAVCVWLVVKQSIWNFPLGLVNVGTFSVVFFRSRLFADAGLQIVYFGKFYPPHHGHKLLIDSARRQVDHLVVMIAAHPSQSISGELRKAWLEEIHPDCDIRLVRDELEDDSRQWAEFTLAYLGRAPDVVFSSEDYGPEYARLMGSQHVMVDHDRAAVPISGRRIRTAPIEFLEYLEPCVRAHFVKRVVLIGAESTGKTTLARLLAQRFQTVWVPEYGREHWERKLQGLTLNDPPPSWSNDEFVHIAQEQQSRENALARIANRVLICDTNAFITGTWHERYHSCRDGRVDAIGDRDKADLYLLTAPDIPFVQDGFRDGESIRHWMHDRFLQQLSERGMPFRLVNGPFDERLVQAVESVNALLHAPNAA